MKIAFFELEGWEREILKKQFVGDELYLSEETLNTETTPAVGDFEIICLFVGSRVTKEVLAACSGLRLLSTRSTGYDHIDLTAAKERGVSVVFVPGYGNNTVAEFAFGLILNLTRKIYAAIDQIKERESFSLDNLRGTDLKGKTIGIIGTGRIGKEAVKIAKGFGMKVLAFDMKPDKFFMAEEGGFNYVSLEELLRQSDVITLHCPYTETTHHLLNKENMKLVKRGAYLVNTARGGIVETEALIAALQDGTLAGAGIDVLEEEGNLKDEMSLLRAGSVSHEKLRTVLADHALMRLPNVLVTPHNAFNSQEALLRILDTTIMNIQNFKTGNLINVVKE